MKFKNVINQTPELNGALKDNLGALEKKYQKQIIMSKKNQCEGSVDIDTHLNKNFNKLYADANRWDYVIGYNNKAYFVEFHSGKDSEVTKILKKLDWIKNWLTTNAPLLKKMTHSFHFVAVGKARISPESSFARRLASRKLKYQGNLTLT